MTDPTTPEQLADILQHKIPSIQALELAAAMLRTLSTQVEQLTREVERTSNNRDMWKAQCERQAAELAALREPGQWRDISTAPKDAAFQDGNNHYAAHILAWWPGAIAPTRCRWWFRDDSDACNFLADGGYAVYPTVFQPLPPSPSSAEGA